MKLYATYESSIEIMLLRVGCLRCHRLLWFLRLMHVIYSSAFNSVLYALTFHNGFQSYRFLGLIRTTSITLLATIDRDKTGTHFTHVNFKHRDNPCTPIIKVRWEVFRCRTTLTCKKWIRFKISVYFELKCLSFNAVYFEIQTSVC